MATSLSDPTTTVYHHDLHLRQPEPTQQEEKKGFLDKVKEKLPGKHKKVEEINPAPPSDQCAADGNTGQN